MTQDEKRAWAAKRLSVFADRREFPKHPVAIKLYVDGFLEIVDDKAEIRFPKEGGGEEVIFEARTKEQLADELIAECYRTIDRCPSLIQMRKIFEDNLNYVPADGRSWKSMVIDE